MANIFTTNRVLAIGLILLFLFGLGAARSSVVSAYDQLHADQASSSGPYVQILQTVDVRSGPGERYLALAAAEPGARFPLLGKSTDGGWWRIDLQGQPAWVPTEHVRAAASPFVPTVSVGSLE
jgi:uncharacterized protein YgiM (DUF1202 family)